MKEILSKQEAVEQYGTEKQKEHFNKYKKFTNNNLEQALIKTLEQHYETVETIKNPHGRGKVYQCEGKKEEISMREDSRATNGKWSVPYTKNMDIIVASVLEQDKITEASQTLNKWCLDFGLITQEAYDLIVSKHDKNTKGVIVEDLISNDVLDAVEDRLLNDYINTYKSLQNQLAGTLNRMKKANIIYYMEVPKGKVKDKSEFIELKYQTFQSIVKMRKELLEKYGIDSWYVEAYSNAQVVKAFKEEYQQHLLEVEEDGKQLNLEYVYMAYGITLKATKKRIITYLEKFNKDVIEEFQKDKELFLNSNADDFKVKRREFVADEAQKKTDKFFKTAEKRVLLGREKKVSLDEYTYDQEYYALFFKQTYVQRIIELQEYYNHEFVVKETPVKKKTAPKFADTFED
ncbi:TPA: hypothetical protein ACGW8Q_005787 [Bacillus cereus]